MFSFGRKKKEDYTLLQEEPRKWNHENDTSSYHPILNFLDDNGIATCGTIEYGNKNAKYFLGVKENFDNLLIKLIDECILPGACPIKLLIAGLIHFYDDYYDSYNFLRRDTIKKGLKYLERSAKQGFLPGIYAYGVALLKCGKEQHDLGLFYLKLAYERGYFWGDDYKNYITHYINYKRYKYIIKYTNYDGRKFFEIKKLENIKDPITNFCVEQIRKNVGFFGNSKKVAKYETLISEWKSQREIYYAEYKKNTKDEEKRIYEEKEKHWDEECERQREAAKLAAEQEERNDPDGSKRRERTKNQIEFDRDCWINAYA